MTETTVFAELLRKSAFFNRARLAVVGRNRLAKVTIGVQGLVRDAQNRVLLVRHGYRPGWHFPGGGVERGEDLDVALARELSEEAGVVIERAPMLFGIYTHFDVFPGDHIALYVIEAWHQAQVPKPNHEIAEQKFFDVDHLPDGLSPGTARRIDEVYRGQPQSLSW